MCEGDGELSFEVLHVLRAGEEFFVFLGIVKKL